MPNHTVSTNVDTMLRAADNDAIRTAIGVGTTDTAIFARLSLNSALSALYFKSATGVERGFFYTDSGGYINYRFGLSGGQFVMQGATGVAATNNGLVWLSATELWTEGANVLAQRRGTNAQTLRIYNTTDGTNKEYLNMGWSANVLNIAASNEGTGVQRDIKLAANNVIIRPAGTDRWIFTNIGHLWAGADNLSDIGASGANRPRTIYAGTAVVAPTVSGANFLSTSSGGAIDLGGDHRFRAPSSGVLKLSDNAETGFNRLQLGGTTSAFPAIKRNGTGIDIRLADDSAYTRLIAGSLGLGTANPVADLDIADTWNAPAITVTGASGNGTTATITFATQATAIQVGATIVVAGINPSGYNGTFVVTASSVTSVSYLNATSAAWVSGGTIERVFTSIKLNVTDTASNAASLLMDLQKGGITQLSVSKTGSLSGKIESNLFNQNAVNINGALFGSQLLGIGNSILINAANVGIGISLGSGFPISWSSNAGSANYADFNIVDLQLRRDGPGILAQRAGVNAQAFRVYNTYTDASNYDRLSLLHSGGQATIVAEGAGTGVASSHLTLKAAGTTRAIIFNTAGSDRWAINSAGNLTAQTDNTYDIGASGANRPRNIYAASNIISGDAITAAIVVGVGSSQIRAVSANKVRLINNTLTDFTALELGEADMGIMRGTGTPEGAVVGKIGSIFLRLDGGASTTLYVKQSGAGTNTGWVAK